MDSPPNEEPVVVVDVKNISDRDRFKLESKSPVVNQQELRKKLLSVKPEAVPKTTSIPSQKTEVEENSSDDEVVVVPKGYRDYVCEKCRKCVEFETKAKKETVCTNCGCELLYHLRDADESPTEDDFNEEWHDSSEDEYE